MLRYYPKDSGNGANAKSGTVTKDATIVGIFSARVNICPKVNVHVLDHSRPSDIVELVIRSDVIRSIASQALAFYKMSILFRALQCRVTI